MRNPARRLTRLSRSWRRRQNVLYTRYSGVSAPTQERKIPRDSTLYDGWVIAAAKVGVDAREKGARYYELIGVEPRKANLFWNAKLSPYVNGRITPLSDGYMFLSMRAS